MSNQTEDDAPGRCVACEHAVAPAFRYCPHCGAALRDQDGQPLSDYEIALGAQIDREKRAERSLVRLWRPATGRLYLFGALLLTAPDAVLLMVFRRYVQYNLDEALAYLEIDAAFGLLTIFLIRLCAQRGPTGELILAGLRMLQVSLVWSLLRMPFTHTHDILNLILFGVLPLTVLGVAALVFRLHLTGIMEQLSLPAAEAEEAEDNEDEEESDRGRETTD